MPTAQAHPRDPLYGITLKDIVAQTSQRAMTTSPIRRFKVDSIANTHQTGSNKYYWQADLKAASEDY